MRCRFPPRRPLNDPPPAFGTVVNGRRTPKYILAWVCPEHELYKNLRGGQFAEVDDSNYSGVIARKWADFGFE
jgi:hypothetical protein